MVTTEHINEWKKQYKKVFKADGDIYFRALQRTEYLALMAKQNENPATFDYELEVTKTCLLAGITEDDLKLTSGLSTVLCDQILQKSGFMQVDVEEI